MYVCVCIYIYVYIYTYIYIYMLYLYIYIHILYIYIYIYLRIHIYTHTYPQKNTHIYCVYIYIYIYIYISAHLVIVGRSLLDLISISAYDPVYKLSTVCGTGVAYSRHLSPGSVRPQSHKGARRESSGGLRSSSVERNVIQTTR